MSDPLRDWTDRLNVLADAVTIVDEGVQTWTDPVTGEDVRFHVVTFTVEKDGIEYGTTFAAGELAMQNEGVYQGVLQSGRYAVLMKAGMIP